MGKGPSPPPSMWKNNKGGHKLVILRYFRFFILGVGFFLLLSIGVLAYLNNSYLKDSGSFTVKQVSSSAPKATSKAMAIDSGASNLQISYDGHYLCYLKDNGIIVEDLTSGQKFPIPQINNMKVSSYKWIYDRDRIIIAETSTSGYPYYGKMYYFDMTDKTLNEIRDNYYNKDIKISLTGSSDSVTDIDMSAQTDLTFLKVTSDSGSSKIWESNIMVSTNSLPDTVTKSIGKIACLKRSETLFYEGASSGKVYQYGNGTPISINGNTDLRILGVDQNDNIYLASMTGDQVKCVYYGTSKDDNWNTINVDPSTKISKLYVTYRGNIYENSLSSGSIVNLITHIKQTYSGEMQGIYEGGFLTQKGDQVWLNNFNS